MYTISNAAASDSAQILALYRSFLGGAAQWNENYPSEETIKFDLSRNALFVMRNEVGEIIGVISIDKDEEVEKLECWSDALQPSSEVSRICVREDYQGRGLVRKLMEHTFNILKAQGKKSVHILVKKDHERALRAYSHMDFYKVGECVLFDKDFYCFEREL